MNIIQSVNERGQMWVIGCRIKIFNLYVQCTEEIVDI